MPATRDTYDPFKDPNIHLQPDPPEPKPAPFNSKAVEDRYFVDRPDPLAGLDRFHPAVIEDEEGRIPYNYRPNRAVHRKKINWGHAAELLAQGISAASTASLVGCEEQRIWRNLRRSRKFRARIDTAAERLKMQADLRFRNLSIHAALQMRHRAEKLDPKTLHWLAERLRLGQAPGKAENLADWLEAVAAPAGPTRRRKAKATAAEASPNRIQQDSTGLNGTELALNGIELASNGTELAMNGIELAPTGALCTPPELDKSLIRL